MVSKLSDFFLSPFLVILGVRLKKKKKKPYDDCAAQSPFAAALLTAAELFLHVVGCRWVPAYFLVNPRSRLSLGTFSDAPACLSRGKL